MFIPIIVLFLVFLLIAFRRLGGLKLRIWQIMSLGALAVLLTGQIKPLDALRAINVDVIIFLFGVFVIGQALEQSGYLSHISYKIFRKAETADMLVMMVIFAAGLASAFLMNDTLAIIGTPVVLMLAAKNRMRPKVLLLALAFSITVGSVMSPIGNPQNLLIVANSGASFVEFLRYLLVPTLINLVIVYLALRFFYKDDFEKRIRNSESPIKDNDLAKLSKISLVILVLSVMIKIVSVLMQWPVNFQVSHIAIVSAFPVLFFSGKNAEVVRKIDWRTLMFFVSMFVLMESVWGTGFFQSVITTLNIGITSIPMIMIVSVLLSQLISNVPLVALYMPMLLHAGIGTQGLMALAAGSTIAGNMLILGAASNVIIIQNAERRGETISFAEFAKIGIPLAIINMIVYWIFLSFA